MGAHMTSQTLTFALGPLLTGFIGPVPWCFAVVHGGLLCSGAGGINRATTKA